MSSLSTDGPSDHIAHTFALLAPYNEAAILTGSWDDWQEHPMEHGDDHVFRATVALPEGIHQYRYRVISKSWFFPGEWKTIADPWARDIRPPTSDDDADSGLITVHDGRVGFPGDNYPWQHDDVPLPPNDALIIYEVSIGDFVAGDEGDVGRYRDVVKQLPYLVDLGVTAIELMPVTETTGEDHWGYLPRYFYAPETAYGNPAGLKYLIDACHEQGIRVILDKVTNHAGSECPLAHIDHDYWFHHENADDFQFGPKFNYDFYDEQRGEFPARAFMLGVLQYWVEEYRPDGIRFDATGIMGHMDFLREAATAVWQKAGTIKPFVRISEHLPLDLAVVEGDGPMDATWFVDFAHQLTSTLSAQPSNGRDPDDWEGLLTAIDPRRVGFTSSQHVVRYLASHDEERLLQTIQAAGITGEEAMRRVHFGATLLLTGYGYPMLYAGEEFGIDTPRTLGANPLDWQRLESPDGSALHDHYRRLIWLRREHPALRGETLELFHAHAETRVLAYVRWDDAGDRVIVVANVSVDDRGGYTIPAWPADGIWRDALTDDLIEAGDLTLTMTLGPWQTRVFMQDD